MHDTRSLPHVGLMHRSGLVCLVVVASSLVAAGLDIAKGAQADIPEWQTIPTHYGDMKVREFGPADAPLVIAIHGMNDNEFIRSEWNPTAQSLAEAGFHVFVPDFHSAPAEMRPGALTGEILRSWLTDFAMHHDGFVPARYRAVAKPKMVVMGKSWGARMAAEAGSMEEVVGTVLAVPVIPDSDAGRLLPELRGEVALLMVEDDEVAPIQKSVTFRKLLGGRETWVQAQKGGHRVVAEFVEPITSFVEGLRERYMHGEL